MNARVTRSAPSRVLLHRKSRCLELVYSDTDRFRLSFEFLRVFSPSAEVRGHAAREPILVPGKRDVMITGIEPVGRYAMRLIFDDGHNTGLYSWAVFDELIRNHDRYWARYLQRLAQAGMTRDSDVVKLSALPKKYHPANSGK